MKTRGVIFKHVLQNARSTILGWGIGMAIFAFYVVAIYPFIQDFQNLDELLNNPVMQAIFGSDALDFASPGGYISYYYFVFGPLVLMVLAVLYGLGITAAEESQGTLDILLSLPVSRRGLILEKFAAFVVILAAVQVLTLAGFVVGMIFTPSLELSIGSLLLALFNMFPVLLFVTAITLLLSTTLRSRGAVGGAAAAVIVASYFINSFAEMMSAPASSIKYLSLFTYYGGTSVLLHGIDWGGFLILTMGTMLALGGAVFAFDRRDIAA